MSSLFSIGEDEMDLDDEDFLLAACVTGSSVHCTTDNSKMKSVLQQDRSTDSSKTQLLRTKEVDKFNSHYSRRPFESLGNINTSDRVSEKKRSSAEPMHRSFSFTSTTVLQRNNAASSANGFHAPLAKRFAIDNNSSPKRLPENMASLLKSSSTPSMKTSESTTVVHKSDKIYPCNSSSFQRNLSSGDSQLQELSKCNLRPGDSLESSKRLDPLNKVSTPYNSTSNFLSEKELPVLNSPSFSTGFRSFSNSKAREIKSASPVWQQRGALRCSSATKGQTGNCPLPIGNTSSSLCNQTERHSANTFHGNLNGAEASTTLVISRQKGYAGLNTPQGHQASTPIVNRSHSRNPSVSKTPTPRKFPGPAGLLPKLSPGQKLDDTSLVSPLPSTRKNSPVENKVSQSNTSEDDDFNRDPWTYMHQDFLKNVPLTKRYTIVKVYNEAIQQRLEQGKVPCLCALVKAFSLTEADASVLLKDPTGEIHGTLHRKVLEDFQTELAPGAGLILKHVSVFSPAPRKHYLNITPGNILHIYPPDPQFTSSQTLASQCTQADNKQEEQRVVIEEEVISELQADCYQGTNTTDERPSVTEKEKEWTKKDCFEDLLEGLDDDDDFLDEALLV